MNTIQQAHILLVDDNTDLLRLLEEQLRGANHRLSDLEKAIRTSAPCRTVPPHRPPLQPRCRN